MHNNNLKRASMLLLCLVSGAFLHQRRSQLVSNFQDFAEMTRHWCQQVQELNPPATSYGDTIQSRCLALSRLEDILADNEKNGDISNVWQIRAEYRQQVHNLQFFTMSLAMDENYIVHDSTLFSKAKELRTVLVGLKSYLMENMLIEERLKVERLKEVVKNSIQNSLPSKEECPLSDGIDCDITEQQENFYGFGAAISQISQCVAIAIGLDKKVVFDPERFKLPGYAFQSPLECDDYSAGNLMKFRTLISPRNLPRLLQHLTANNYGSVSFPHPTLEMAWYTGILAEAFVKPREYLLERTRQRLSKWNLLGGEPFAGVHIRCNPEKTNEARPNPLQKYFFEVEEWFAVEEMRRGKSLRRLVFIATDGEVSMMNGIRAAFPHFELFFDPEVMKSTQPNVPEGELTRDRLVGRRDFHKYAIHANVEYMVMDMFTLIQADLFVGTDTSTYGQLVHRIRSARDPFLNFFNSIFIDNEFVFFHEQHPIIYVAVDSQEGQEQINPKMSQRLNILNLLPGDHIKLWEPWGDVVGSEQIPLSDGLMFGIRDTEGRRGTRENKRGYFFKHKVVLEHWLEH